MHSKAHHHSHYPQPEHDLNHFSESPKRTIKLKSEFFKDEEHHIMGSHHKVLGERNDEILNRTPLNRCKTQENLVKSSFMFKSYDKQKSYISTEKINVADVCSPSSKDISTYIR